MTDLKKGDLVQIIGPDCGNKTYDEKFAKIVDQSLYKDKFSLRRLSNENMFGMYNFPRSSLRKIIKIDTSDLSKFGEQAEGKTIYWSAILNEGIQFLANHKDDPSMFYDHDGNLWAKKAISSSKYFWYYYADEVPDTEIKSNYKSLCKCTIETKIRYGHTCGDAFAPY